MREIRSRFAFRMGVAITLAVSCCLFPAGCGQKAVPLEVPAVADPVGKPGFCEHCRKRIEAVKQQQLADIHGGGRIVCDERCRAGLNEWLRDQ